MFGKSSRTVARAIVRGRAWIAAFWAVAFVALAPVARHVDTALDVAGNRTGASAASEVERRLATDFASPFARYALLVITGVMLAGIGLLAELMVRTYYESSGKRIYSVREIIN